MKRRLAILGAVILSFLLGSLLSEAIGWPALEGKPAAESEVDIPAAVLKSWFPPIGEYDTGGEPLDEERFEELMAALDAAMTAEETLADLEREATLHLRNLARRVAIPEITPGQRERISAYLTEFAGEHPHHRALIERGLGMVERYGPPAGKDRIPRLALGLRPMSLGRVWDHDPDGGPFGDAEVDGLLAGLDALLGAPETLGAFEREAHLHLVRFGRNLQRGSLTPEQTARVLAHHEELEAKHPGSAEMIEESRFLIEKLSPGRVAPNIVGRDTDGAGFALEEHRGDIVVLIFSGQWCGPCRGEYPYQRAMLDIYQNDPVVLLGVNSDLKVETIREAKKVEKLAYRTWWDGHGQEDGGAPPPRTARSRPSGGSRVGRPSTSWTKRA